MLKFLLTFNKSSLAQNEIWIGIFWQGQSLIWKGFRIWISGLGRFDSLKKQRSKSHEIPLIFFLCKIAQENVMNAHGEFVYSMSWFIKPKNITTISTMQIIIRMAFQKTVLLDGNKDQYQTYIFRGHRFWVGLLASVHSTVQVHSCWGLLVDWVPST